MKVREEKRLGSKIDFLNFGPKPLIQNPLSLCFFELPTFFSHGTHVCHNCDIVCCHFPEPHRYRHEMAVTQNPATANRNNCFLITLIQINIGYSGTAYQPKLANWEIWGDSLATNK